MPVVLVVGLFLWINSAKADTASSQQTTTISNDMENTTKVLLETTFGDIELVLYNETPLHRDNFIKLAPTMVCFFIGL